VSPAHLRRGLATQILQKLLEFAESIGCDEAWVLTERSNAAAMRLYASLGGNEAPEDQVMFTFALGGKEGR